MEMITTAMIYTFIRGMTFNVVLPLLFAVLKLQGF